MASIKYQIVNVVDSAFMEGEHDKHSAKSNEGTIDKIYSYKEMDNIKSTGIEFAQYCKSEFSIKQLKDITPNMVSKFLESKAEKCRQSSLDQYASRLSKLGNLINNHFKSANVNFKVDIPISKIGQDKLRDLKMERSDYEAVLNYAEKNNSNSQAPIALEMAARFGMRVSETCKLQPRDVDLENKKLHIHESKGKRNRDIPLKEDDITFLKSIIGEKKENTRIISIKEDSVNKYLARTFEKLGIEKYNSAKTGIHSIRKMAATSRYLENLKSGMSEKDAEREVSVWLGHGEDRADVIQNYIYK